MEAKRAWQAACSSPTKKVLLFKKYIKENGPINLPGVGKIIGGQGQGGPGSKIVVNKSETIKASDC